MKPMERPDRGVSFHAFDPETRDPGYWDRFRHRVLAAAAPELARRRARRPASVSDIVFGWRNAVVPTALLAAAVAALLLVREPTLVDPTPIALEELLLSGIEGEPIPAVLTDEAGDGTVRLSVHESF